MRGQYLQTRGRQHVAATGRLVVQDAVVEQIDGMAVVYTQQWRWRVGRLPRRASVHKPHEVCQLGKRDVLVEMALGIEQRLAEDGVAEATAQPLHLVAIFQRIAVADSPYTFGCNIACDTRLHLHEYKAPLLFICLI